MHEFIIFTISGLATAGIYAITASGLTLTYATTGIFNFAAAGGGGGSLARSWGGTRGRSRRGGITTSQLLCAKSVTGAKRAPGRTDTGSRCPCRDLLERTNWIRRTKMPRRAR